VNSGTKPPSAYTPLRAFMLVAGALVMTAARADDLSRYCGHEISSRNIALVGRPLDPSTCSANCFHFVLTCTNGHKFNLASRYNPYDPDWFNWFTQVYPFPQLLVFGLIAFAAFVMASGKPRKPVLNAVYLGIVALAMFFWPSMATSGLQSPAGGLTSLAVTFAFFGLPVFLLLNLPALMRGWNYLFVKHSVAPIVTPALQAGAPIDAQAVAQALSAGAYDTGAHPAYYYENQAKKARVITANLEADAAAADALRRREEARAELAEAERILAQARQRGESGR
jgi:hypothetical protein